ncbi:MAG: sporulation protein SpoIID, partial [Synechococcaceae cyanobacterium]
MAIGRSGSLITNLLRHPLSVSVPLATAAIGIGIAGQALLRPAPSSGNADLLDALIAQPKANPAAAQQPSESLQSVAAAASDSTPSVMAQRAQDGALPDPAGGRSLNLEIRVALLKASPQPTLSASGPWLLRDRQGQVLQRGNAGESADVNSALDNRAEVWLETAPNNNLTADGQAYEGRLRVLRGSNGLQLINHLPLES